MKSFVKDLKLVVIGCVGGVCIIALPIIIADHLRPILHHLY